MVRTSSQMELYLVPDAVPQIAFLTYLSRSGSTFLARRLDRFPEISVSLEARIPDGLHHGEAEVSAKQEIDSLLARLYSDEKFSAWGIERQELRAELEKMPLPFGFAELLPLVLRMQSAKEDSSIYFYKCASYIHYVEQLRAIFPSAHFVFVLRDIRSIFESQKRSLDSKYGKPMAGSPVAKALMFNEVCRILEKFKDEDWFHIVSFERLMESPDEELESLSRSLGVGSMPLSDSDEAYLARLPEAQRHLHTNASKAPQKDKQESWRSGLSDSELAVLENISGQTLTRWGYHLSGKSPRSWKTFIGVHLNGLSYAARCLKHGRRPLAPNLLAPCYGR